MEKTIKIDVRLTSFKLWNVTSDVKGKTLAQASFLIALTLRLFSLKKWSELSDKSQKTNEK